MTETSNEVEDESKSPEFVDKLIHLDNGSLLIGRIILHSEQENFVYVYRPVEIWVDETGSHMRAWIPESSDEFFSIPTRKVTSVCEPRNIFMQTYHDTFMGVTAKQPVEPVPAQDTRVLH